MATKRKPSRREEKKQERAEIRQAEAGVRSAQNALAQIIASADPQSVKKR